MNLYDRLMAPLENKFLAALRRLLIQQADGHILEIGVGTGANFRFYNWPQVASLTALDRQIDAAARSTAPPMVRFTEGSALQLPFTDGSFDTVVETLVFCTVPDLQRSLAEVKRVLKSDGRLMFIDHVLPENKMLAAFFKAANILWPHLANGCSLTRQIQQEIISAGFCLESSGSRGAAVFRWGIARPLPSTEKSASESGGN